VLEAALRRQPEIKVRLSSTAEEDKFHQKSYKLGRGSKPQKIMQPADA
jgi:hypothetical protein